MLGRPGPVTTPLSGAVLRPDTWLLKKTSQISELRVLLHGMRGVVSVEQKDSKSKAKAKPAKALYKDGDLATLT